MHVFFFQNAGVCIYYTESVDAYNILLELNLSHNLLYGMSIIKLCCDK